MPNAGKSTLISRVSAARPKVADYPFTTLVPNLGVVRGLLRHSFVMADIPGLIEGAHEGRGLGIRFLKHVERTKVLLHLLDPIDRRPEDIIRDYKIVERELNRYSGELSGKARIVVVNKMDTVPGKDVEVALMKFFGSIDTPLFFISAVSGANIPLLLEAVERVLI